MQPLRDLERSAPEQSRILRGRCNNRSTAPYRGNGRGRSVGAYNEGTTALRHERGSEDN